MNVNAWEINTNDTIWAHEPTWDNNNTNQNLGINGEVSDEERMVNRKQYQNKHKQHNS